MNLGLSRVELLLLGGALAIIVTMVGVMTSELGAMSAQTYATATRPAPSKDSVPWFEISTERVEVSPSNGVVVDHVPENRDISRPRRALPVGIERLSRTAW